jgi:hypothetical protein
LLGKSPALGGGGIPGLEKRETWGTPGFSSVSFRAIRVISCAGVVGHPPYEQEIPLDKWEHMRRIGVVSGDEIPGPNSLAEREEELQSLVELYVSTSRPELLSYFKTRVGR